MSNTITMTRRKESVSGVHTSNVVGSVRMGVIRKDEDALRKYEGVGREI